MEYIIDKDKAFIRLNKGEDLFPSLEKVAKSEGWTTAHLSGIGALKDIELGFYDLEEKKYGRKHFADDAELLSMDGNLCLNEGAPFFHIHAVLSGHDFSCFGGHLFAAKVAVTCEINLRLFKGEVVRKPNDDVGLNLLHFCSLQ